MAKTAYVTNVRVSAFEVTEMEYCMVCSARVEVAFAQNASHWCKVCAKTVSAVRVSKLARFKILPTVTAEVSANFDIVQDGIRTVAFGAAAQALEDMNMHEAIEGRSVRVRMTVRRAIDGIEALIHAC